MWRRRIEAQWLGMLALVWTTVKMTPRIARLMLARPHCHNAEPAADPAPVLRPASRAVSR